MLRNSRGAATHSQRLEKWLGAPEVARLVDASRDFYWPIALHGVPGRVYAMPGGDFAGHIDAGSEASALDRAEEVVSRHQRTTTRHRLAQMFPRQRGAFGNLSVLLDAQRGGKAQTLIMQKDRAGAGGVNQFCDMWYSTGLPGVGVVGAAAPGGTAMTNLSVGAIAFANPTNANTCHVASALVSTGGSGAGFDVRTSGMLYDRLFSVAKTMNSTATEAVTGVPTRYTSQTSTNGDYIGGNFLFPANSVVLAATAHNWTVCKYTNQAGTTGQSVPSIAGNAGNSTGCTDLPVSTGGWFMPLASGDVGVKALTQMQCDALVATGSLDFVVGHPICVVPAPISYLTCALDGINTAFNLATVYDNACLAWMEFPCPGGRNAAPSALFTLVSE